MWVGWGVGRSEVCGWEGVDVGGAGEQGGAV